MTDDRPDRRVALVLAASRGLGRGCAEALADAGFDLVVCARSTEGVDDTVSALEARRARAVGATADVSDAGDLARLFGLVDETYGRLDVVVANAGGPPPGGVRDLDDDAWRRGFELTLMSAVRSLGLAIPRMEANCYGRFIIIGSSSVRRPIPNLTLSNAYRPALAGLVKSAAVELAPTGITVNIVSPGRVDTDRVRDLDARAAEREGISPDEARTRSEASIPMGRYGSPADVGGAVAYLASEAAGYVTGQSLLVDGGMVPTLP